jgi:hypothetical protein
MNRFGFVSLTVILAAPVTAQTPSQPHLVLSIFAGATTGNQLWTVGNQPFCVLQGTVPNQSCSSIYDTLRLSREETASIIAGVAATYFPGPHVGYSLEVFYLGLPLDDTCTGVYYNPDPQSDPFYGNRNAQLCDNISRAPLSISAIGFFGGVTLRAAASRSISPYVRAGAGVVTYTTGTIEMSGVYVENGSITSRAVYLDDHPKQTAFSGEVAGGVGLRLGPAYQFRLELRDVMVPLQTVGGPSGDFLRPPTKSKLFHHAALTLGLDVVLEKSRGRRY